MANDNMTSIHGIPTTDNIPKQELEQSTKDRQRDNKDTARVHFPEWAKKILHMINTENSDEELRRIRKITKMMRYYRGEQRGFWSHTTGDWVTINPDDFEPRDAAMLLINNQIRPMIKTLAKEWVRSRTSLKCRARKDTIQTKGAARFGSGVLEKEQTRIMPESFKQVEGKSAFLAGNYLRYTYFNKNANKYSTTIPRIEKVNKQAGVEYSYCPDCNKEASGLVGECPSCGQQMMQNKPETKQISSLTGVEKLKIGCIETAMPDVREIKIHLRARKLGQTPYLRWSQYVMVAILKQEYPWANIKTMPASPITRYIQETELSSGTSGSHHRLPFNYDGYGSGLGGMTEYNRVWLRPSMYFDLVEEKGVTLGSGKKIEIGERYIDLYPNGMFLAYNGTELLDIRNEVMDTFWAHGSYDPLIESFWGDGLEDLIQMQELVNEMQSLFVENIIYNASPKIIYNPWLIEASMFSNDPSEMTPLTKHASRDSRPQDAVYQLSGMSIASDVPNAMTAAMETMRNQSGAHLSMSGTREPGLNTATAMAIARDASVAQLGPALALKSETDVTWAYQVLSHHQENWVDGISDKLLGDFSVQEAKWFKECNIEEDLEIIAEPGSWIPRTDLEVRNDFLSFITAGGLPLGFANPQVPYEIKQKAAELFRMPVDLDKLQPDIRNAHMRIEQIEAVARILIQEGIISESTDNQDVVNMIVADVPVDTFIDDHPIFVNTYISWLKTDPGKFASVVVRDSVELLIQRHYEAQDQLTQYQFEQDAKYAAASQALSGMVEQATQPQQPEQQAPTEPLPSGTQSKRPTTSQAKASSSKTPTGSSAPVQ